MDAPATLVRTYRGHQQSNAVQYFQQDAATLAQHGYYPTSQSWAQGQWGCGAFLIALVLFIFVIGIFVFIYMLVVKPDGTLTVTYSRAAAPPVQGPPQIEPNADLKARLQQLDDARNAGAITEVEHAQKRAEILSRF